MKTIDPTQGNAEEKSAFKTKIIYKPNHLQSLLYNVVRDVVFVHVLAVKTSNAYSVDFFLFREAANGRGRRRIRSSTAPRASSARVAGSGTATLPSNP